MWFEILPSIGVIFGAMCVGIGAQSYVPYLILGKPSHRRLFHNYEHEYWLRDYQLTGDAYKLQGLEGIPDAEPKAGGESSSKTK